MLSHTCAQTAMSISTAVAVFLCMASAAAAVNCDTGAFWTVNYTYTGCSVPGATSPGCGQNGWGGPSTVILNSVIQTPSAPMVLSGNGVMHLDNRVITASDSAQQLTTLVVPNGAWAGGCTTACSGGGDTLEIQFDVYFAAPTADGFFVAILFASSTTGGNGTYLALESSPANSAGLFAEDSARLYTIDSAAGSHPQQVRLERQHWYTIRYRCTFDADPNASEPCYTFVNDTLAIVSTTWKVAQRYDYARFSMTRAPAFYGLLNSQAQGVQIDNFFMKVYNISDPERPAANYSTGFEVCPANVDGCQQALPFIRNNGTCQLPRGTALGSNGDFTVTCPYGFVGTYCEFRDPCLSNPCLHNATCSAYPSNGQLFCSCPAQWSGWNCGAVNPCISSPCQNGAQCSFQNNGFHCTCPTGYVGTMCQFPDPCRVSDPCGFHGICSANPTTGARQCTCDSPYAGERCSEISAAAPNASASYSLLFMAGMTAVAVLKSLGAWSLGA